MAKNSDFDQTRTAALRSELAKTLSGQYKAMLDKIVSSIESAEPTTLNQVDQIVSKIRGGLGDLEPRAERAIQAYLRQSYMRGKDLASTEIESKTGHKFKIGLGVTHNKALKNLGKVALADIKNINNDIDNHLRRSLYESIQNGEGVAGMKQRIKDMYGKFSAKEMDNFQKDLRVNPEYRAQVLARTTMVKAFNTGNLEQMKQSGFIKKKRWITGRDERVCPICAPLNGKVVPVDSNFKTTRKGKEYEFPTPPAHPNCRCIVQAVIEEEK